MSITLPSHYKIPCPFCQGEIKVPADHIGELSSCPHCKEEITLDLPNYEPNRNYSATSPATVAQVTNGVSQERIAIGYLVALIVPLIGFVIGIYFLAKNQFGHGIGCMIVSLIANTLWFLAIMSFASL